MAIRFFFTKKISSLRCRTKLKGFLQKALKEHGRKAGNVNYIFCSDSELLEINQQHLQHDYFTDIITFDLSTTKGQLDADIYISVDRVKDNASQLGVTIQAEIHRVIFHGMLHLCGLKDKKDSEIKKMRAAEEELLKKYFK